MQPENPHIPPHSPSEDPSFPPSSPPIHPFHRPYAPPPTYDTPDALAGLRRRQVAAPEGAGPTVEGMVRIAIRDPYADESRHKGTGVPVSIQKRIGDLKDEIASGSLDEEGTRWVREGMRLVWQGRIVGDGEAVGDVIGPHRDYDQVHIFHLVARRIGHSPRPLLSHQVPIEAAPVASSSSSPVVTRTTSPTRGDKRTIQALLDCTHYLLFTARHHLCHLTSIPPLAWDDVHPKPTVPQSVAREAVMSVLRVFESSVADSTTWGAWEGAFEGNDSAETSALADSLGKDGMRVEVRSLWSTRLGREWRDGQSGEVVQVEVEGTIRDLHLPPLDKLSPSRMAHLLLYLRITSLLPHISHLLEIESRPLPTPTPTLPPPPLLLPPRPANAVFSQVPLPVLNHLFFSALKISAMLWMLLGNLKWSDRRVWIMYSAAFLYWAIDGWRVYQAALPRRGRPGVQPPAPAGGGVPRGNDFGEAGGNAAAGVPPAARVRAGTGAGAAQGADAAADPIRRVREYRNRNPWMALPLVHLDTDSLQLHIPAFSTQVDFEREVASQIANDPERADAIRRRAGRVPLWIQTQLLLPIALWVLTLIPEWESLRARAIRKRERAMRVLVGEMTNAATDAVTDENPEEAGDQTQPGVPQAAQNREPVLPVGLGSAAEKYYRRVLQKGEGIDWQEEAEAQRLLGIGEEEEERDGGGMRMGVL